MVAQEEMDAQPPLLAEREPVVEAETSTPQRRSIQRDEEGVARTFPKRRRLVQVAAMNTEPTPRRLPQVAEIRLSDGTGARVTFVVTVAKPRAVIRAHQTVAAVPGPKLLQEPLPAVKAALHFAGEGGARPKTFLEEVERVMTFLEEAEGMLTVLIGATSLTRSLLGRTREVSVALRAARPPQTPQALTVTAVPRSYC